jgi:hypothetical protein
MLSRISTEFLPPEIHVTATNCFYYLFQLTRRLSDQVRGEGVKVSASELNGVTSRKGPLRTLGRRDR